MADNLTILSSQNAIYETDHVNQALQSYYFILMKELIWQYTDVFVGGGEGGRLKSLQPSLVYALVHVYI